MIRFTLSFLTLFITIIFSAFILLPKAEAACTINPTWQFLGWTGGVRSVTYHLRLVNNCAGTNTFRVRVSNLPTSPDELHADWRVEQDNGDFGPLNTMVRRKVDGAVKVDIRVIRDIDYYHEDAEYKWVEFRAALDSNTDIFNTFKYSYIVQNAPDLTVTRFEFPGGPSCETTNAIVRIRNLGWKSFSGNFDVRVYNGNDNNGRTFRVSQFVNAREFLNLDSRFKDMNRPYPNDWVARLVLDLQNEIREENENDNEEKYKYKTTPCITPTVTQPPATSTPTPTRVPGTTITPTPSPIPGTTNTPTPTRVPGATNTPTPTPTPTPVSGDYFIKGGVYIDEDLSRTKNGEETYTGGNISIRNVNTGAIVNTPSSAEGTGFTSILLPAGRYSITYIAPEGAVVTYPTITPPTIIMNLGSSCIDETPDGDPTCDVSGNIINVNFGIEPVELIPDPWIKGIGGDMRVDNGMENIIPDSSSYFSENYKSIYDMDHGIVFGNSDLILGGSTTEKANPSRWFADVPFSFPKVNTKYSEMWNTLYKGGILTEDDNFFSDACELGGIPECILRKNLQGGVYSAGENVKITNDTYEFLSNQDYIFLIKKNLIIESNLIVPLGTTVLFIVEGDITVAPDVGRIQGIYSTDNNFIVQSSCDVCGIPDIPLLINGSVIANANQKEGEKGEFINERDLGSENATTPAVLFSYRPDFILNMPQLLRYKSYSIREIAPGADN